MTKAGQVKQMVGFKSRNRPDILKEIEGEEVKGSDIESDGRHLTWHTSPEELERLVGVFSSNNWNRSTNVYVPSASVSSLSLRQSKTDQGLRFKQFVGWDITLYLDLPVLKRFAQRLARASWEKPLPNHEYGSDRKVAKVQVGDDLITLIWTPEKDKNGVSQINEMQWRAYWNKQMRAHVESMKDLQRRMQPRIRPSRPMFFAGG